MGGAKTPKEVADFGKLIQHALPGVGLPPRVLPRDDKGTEYVYRPYSASKEVRGVLAHFPKPWRGMQGIVLWFPDHTAQRLSKFEAAGGVTFGTRGLSLLEVAADGPEIFSVNRQLSLVLKVSDAYVWDGTNLSGATLPDRLSHVSLTDAGPSCPPPVVLRPCEYARDPPVSGAWARLPLYAGVTAAETVDPGACVVRAVCQRSGEACVLGDSSSLVPFVLSGAPREREGQHALFEFVRASGTWRCLEGAACVGPAMGVAEAVARLARVAI